MWLTVDIGSTYTKLTAVDPDRRRIVGTAQAFTTVQTDVTEGFHAALDRLTATTGVRRFDETFCCSSAAGGLKMVALGLVPDLTAKAARTAAANAGAKVVKTYAYEISREEAEEIHAIAPDLVLLCGGTDGGNKEVILANARRLCELDGAFTVVVAGNKSAADEIAALFRAAGRAFEVTRNVMPRFGELCIEPARDCIRRLFIRQIVAAKGLGRMRVLTADEIVPTPLAVLRSCELLSRGTPTCDGLGELMVVDIGGATTDVYSMAAGTPTQENTLMKGLPEPWGKRTVEGDLGMRYSLPHVLEAVSPAAIAAEADATEAAVEAWATRCAERPDLVPQEGSAEERIEEACGRQAVALAVRRHCGRMAEVYTPLGLMHTLEGKDLTAIPLLIGVGGVLLHARRPLEILRGAVQDGRHPDCALPGHPRCALDSRYIFAAMGLLAERDADLACELLKNELTVLTETPKHTF